jgi:hypothetical protein
VNNFLGPLRLDYIDGRAWQVVEGFTYRIGTPDGEEFVAIPPGFVTDFASVPRLLKWLWPSPGGLWDKPAVVHDFIYRFGYVERNDGTIRYVTRLEGDGIFNEGMTVTGTRVMARRCLYRGVRIGGWVAWNRHRRAQS